ncbi:MAG: type II secretion system F family protein [Pseudolabrys sp.]|nr:type II secretion system F family protein [Pseudolabrys sp.]MCW5686548.1 type II secretion system F family protein [Pseudolabrys sp.]
MMQPLALFFLVTVAIGGIAWVFLYPILSGEKKAEQRRANIAKAEPVVTRQVRGQKSRRDSIEGTLREMEERHKKQKRQPLTVRITQAGLSWSKQRYYITSAVLGIGAFLAGTIIDTGLLTALGLGFAAGLGVPSWLLKFLKKRREEKFIDALPDAVDVIVRGIKAGLPLLDSLKVITIDSPEPLRSEFAAIVETQAVGMPLGEACSKLYDRMPLPEANFFGIVIAIQQKSGGNLSEALGNLSRVLRDRKKMKGKIKAMSTEAKASAAIIGALPIAVMCLVYITSPDYIVVLFTEPMGRLMLAGSAVWMTMGILVMRKMINFDF